MISDSDAEFHPGPYTEPLWAETNYFGFYVPDVPMNIGVYALFRPNQRVVNTTISFNSAHTDTPWGADYWDTQVHVPFPASKSLLDYELANGLHVVCEDPNRVWKIVFDDGEGTTVDVRYEALTPAFDINDPEMDPMVRAQAEGSDFNWGTAYNGHFDQSGRSTGYVTLRGERHEVDCVSTMDHSWGPRPERSQNNMSWLHAHHDDGTLLHAILDWESSRPDDTSALKLTHGYAQTADGEFRGLAAGEGTSRREGWYPVETQLTFTDEDGGTWELSGQPRTAFPWQCWPDMVGFNTLHEWTLNDRAGFWGEIMDFVPMHRLCSHASESRRG